MQAGEMKTRAIGISLAVGVVCTTRVVAQIAAHASYAFSTDNGTTWQAHALTVPQSQPSVLIRMNMTVLDGGVSAPTNGLLYFSEALFESYVTTATPSGDSLSDIAVLRSPAVGGPPLVSGPYAGRRVGNVLAVDRINDVTPLGSSPGVFISNVATPFGSGPFRQNPLTVLQYRLQLDGSGGDRVCSSAFLPYSTFFSTASANEVSVTDGRSGTNQFVVVPVTQTPATLTVIPAPGSAVIVAGTALFVMRRNR
jgi:hypothetical protein